MNHEALTKKEKIMNLAELNLEQLKQLQELAAMQARKIKLAEKIKTFKPHCKIATNGSLQLYLGDRYPVQLYARQWESLIANIETVKSFLAENKNKIVYDYTKSA